MPVPLSDPGHPAGSSEPESFALQGWRLATCLHDGSTGSADCVACRAALESLILEEDAQRTTYLADQITAWKTAGLLSTSAARRVLQAVEQAEQKRRPHAGLRLEATVPVAVAAEQLASPPRVAAPPVRVPARPPFTWRGLGESLLAERTLNTLLGLGAFLILAAALVISVFNPTRLTLAPHVGVLAGTMALFYVAGYVCYTRLRLTRGGETLLVIAAAFVPLEVWTIGGADGLGLSLVQLWAASSVVALGVYAISYVLLPGRAFGVLLAVAGASLPLSALASMGSPAEWTLCAGVVLGLGYTLGASRLRASRWRNLRLAMLGVAHVATPPILLTLVVARFLDQPPSTGLESISDYAVGGAWWLGVAMYAATALLYRKAPFEAIAAWLTPVAYLLTLTKAPWEPAWYGVWFVGLGVLYAQYARRSARSGFRNPAAPVAMVLMIGGVLWAAVSGLSWALFAAVFADAVLSGVTAIALRRARVGFAAVGLLAGAFGLMLQLVHWPNWSADKPWPWLILALLLGIGAEVHLRACDEQPRPLRELVAASGRWRATFAPAAFDASLIVALLALGLAVFGGLNVASVVFGTIGMAAAAVAWTRRSAIFLYPASVLVALAVLMAGLALTPALIGEPSLLTGMALAVLGGAFALTGSRLGRAAGVSYVWPLWLTGLVLSVAGPALAVFNGDPLQPDKTLVAAACAIGYAAVLATIRRPVWAYPVAIWLVASYELALKVMLPGARPSFFLGALVLPTCCALVVAAFATRRAAAERPKDAFAIFQFARAPWGLPPLIVALIGFAASITTASLDSAVGAIVLATYAVVLGAIAFGYGDRPGERWTSLSLLLTAGLVALDWAGPRAPAVSPVLASFAVALALLSVLANRSRRLEVSAWRMPLEWLAIGSAAAGELLAFNGSFGRSASVEALSSALCAVVQLTIAYARRFRWLAYAGVATLILAALIEVAAAQVLQPQAYALPVGAYLMGLAWLEWRRGDRSRLKAPFELSALLVLLGTTVLQGVGYLGDGLSRYPYDVALILEGLAVVGVGAGVHWWRSLSAGAAAVVLAVLILLAEPLATVNTWYLVGSLGLLLMGGVVLLERRRQQIPTWLDGWRERLETWG